MRTLTLAVLCFVAFPATALAKGPDAATIEGPGLASPLKIDGSGSWDQGGPFVRLVEETAFFTATWGGDDALLRARPAGELGPRFRVTYNLPGPAGRADPIRQDLYPYARGGPVSFMPSGQPFFETRRTIGGWYRGSTRLKTALLAAGLPAQPKPKPTVPPHEDSAPPLGLWALLGAMVLAAATVVALRRRARPASA
jgi:hypothetical protein